MSHPERIKALLEASKMARHDPLSTLSDELRLMAWQECDHVFVQVPTGDGFTSGWCEVCNASYNMLNYANMRPWKRPGQHKKEEKA